MNSTLNALALLTLISAGSAFAEGFTYTCERPALAKTAENGCLDVYRQIRSAHAFSCVRADIAGDLMPWDNVVGAPLNVVLLPVMVLMDGSGSIYHVIQNVFDTESRENNAFLAIMRDYARGFGDAKKEITQIKKLHKLIKYPGSIEKLQVEISDRVKGERAWRPDNICQYNTGYSVTNAGMEFIKPATSVSGWLASPRRTREEIDGFFSDSTHFSVSGNYTMEYSSLEQFKKTLDFSSKETAN